MIGVNYDLFWTLNPKSLSPFIKAFSLKEKYDDRMAWHSGLYIKMAIASALSKDNKYPSTPILGQKLVLTDEEKMERFKQIMKERMSIINSRFEKEGDK